MDSTLSVENAAPLYELYERYLQLVEAYRDDALRYTPPGQLRNTLLRRCRPLPFEQFEARMTALPKHPEFAFLAKQILQED